MKKIKKIFKGLSFKFDALFFRNLTLIVSTILIWRGVWNFVDSYFFPHNHFLSNLLTIVLGIVLLFIFDSEVEETENEIERTERFESKDHEHKHKHLLNDLL